MRIRPLILLVAIVSAGCTSFKTTIMQRAADSRFYPNFPCAKTQGVPVKLKVPTHVEVRITEAFFVQNSAGAVATAAATAADITTANAAKAQSVANAKQNQATNDQKTAQTALDAATTSGDADAIRLATADLAAKKKAAADAKEAFTKADDALAVATADAALAKKVAAAVPPKYSEAKITNNGHRLRNLSVNTRLVYTDKVFTVDFRRPAGGILNLSSIAMDSQQYFAAIQANYEEQTLQQINASIGAVAGGTQADLSKLSQGTVTTAPTAVEIPAVSTTGQNLDADSRIVALARFDISEPDWEDRLHEFVDKHVTGCIPTCPVGTCPVQQ